MIGLVIVSHSEKIAEGIKELASQVAPAQVNISAAGGTRDGRLGTDAEAILKAINEVYSKDGVIILFDLGSALMSAEMAVECLEDEMRKRVVIADAPLVEGAVVAAVEISIGRGIDEVKATFEELRQKSKLL